MDELNTTPMKDGGVPGANPEAGHDSVGGEGQGAGQSFERPAGSPEMPPAYVRQMQQGQAPATGQGGEAWRWQAPDEAQRREPFPPVSSGAAPQSPGAGIPPQQPHGAYAGQPSGAGWQPPHPGQTYTAPRQPYTPVSYASAPYGVPVVTKDHVAAGLLAIFLGVFGVHKFYLGYNTSGFIILAITILGSIFTIGLAAGTMFVITVIEGIIYLSKSQSEFDAAYVVGKKEWF
ncbi:MAG: TM2 domain-containing protein [Eggerthellaceae bacterium]|nr:TM2 domain-containing protein [Eggerthellaceae bacterium]